MNSNPTPPFGMQQKQQSLPTPGEIYSVDPTSTWRSERAWCLDNYCIDPQMSLVYHFSDGSEWCCYNFDENSPNERSRTSIGYMVPHGVEPSRWACQKKISFKRIEPSSDACVHEIIRAYISKTPSIQLIGWSISNIDEVYIPAFAHNRSGNFRYYEGEIVLSNPRCSVSSTVPLGSLDEAVVALSYVKHVLKLPIAHALAQLHEYETESYESMRIQGYDPDPIYTIYGLQGAILQKEAIRYQNEKPLTF